jgi:hypothetical protein
MSEPRKQYLVGVKGSQTGADPLLPFREEVSALSEAEPQAMRDPRYMVVQLTDAQARQLGDKYRDTLLIEPDAPLQL